MALEISIQETKKDAYLVSLTGELDTLTAADLEKQILPILPKAIAVVFDLSKLTYISSMGLRVMAITKKAMSAKNGAVMVANPQPQIQAVFEATRILSDDLLATLEEADSLLDSYLDKVQKGLIKPYRPKNN